MIYVIPHLIVQEGNRVLLLKRAITKKTWGDYWHCVTGTIELGESPQETIIREAKEEIGIDIQRPQLITTLSVEQDSIINPGKRFHSLELFFLYNLKDYDAPSNIEPHKHSALEWFAIDKLPEKVIPHVEIGINNFIEQKKYNEYKL